MQRENLGHAAALVALGLAALLAYGLAAEHGPALVDEYIYLAGGRHFSETGSLDARFYNSTALLRQGYPHQDMHAPGYVILLGAAMRVFGASRATAVGLNAAAYLAGALLLRALALRLGAARTPAFAAAALFLFLPLYLPYVFWVLPEVLVGVLALAALVASAGDGMAAAAGAGLLLGGGFVVRESLVFVVPAALALCRSRRRALAMLAVAGLVVLAVYVPLSKERGEGGTNVWRATREGNAISFDVFREAGALRLGRAASLAKDRAQRTLSLLAGPNVTWAERGILLLYAGLLLLPLAGLRRRAPAERRLYAGHAAGSLLLVAVMLAFLDVPPWSAPRYLMLAAPPLLLFCVPPTAARALAAGVLVACLFLDVATRGAFDRYVEVRRRRQEASSAYLEEYVGKDARRVFANDAYLFGWRRYPTEVIVALPSPEQLLALERQLRLDYVVLPRDWEGASLFDRLPRYELVNRPEVLAEQTDLRVYRRVTP